MSAQLREELPNEVLLPEHIQLRQHSLTNIKAAFNGKPVFV